MTTREFLTYLENKCKETRPVLLQLTNEVLQFIYSKPLAQTLYSDPTTGLPPYLITNGNLRYTFPDGTYTPGVLRTIAVLTMQSNLAGYLSLDSHGRRREYKCNGKNFYEVKVTSLEATTQNPAELTFIDETPGTTTNVYFHLFTKKCPDLSAPTIEMPIPRSQHLSFAHGVIALYKDEKYGDLNAWEYFVQRIAPRIWDAMNQGAQGSSYQIAAQIEHQNWEM